MSPQEFYVLAEETLSRASYPAVAFLVTVNAVLLFDRLAPSMGLVDRPDALRKLHVGTVSTVGGPAIFLGVGVAIALLQLRLGLIPVMALSTALALLGVLDDLFDIRASYRLVVQAAVALTMATALDATIVDLGNLFGYGNIVLGSGVAIAFTVMCTIGTINAINMIDGLDGLAGSLLLVSFAALAWVGLNGDHHEHARLAAVVCGALIAFLCFNARIFIPRARVFMGDSGSMLLGFLLLWLLVTLSQGQDEPLSAVTAGWIFGLPLVDTVSVVVRRLTQGRHPLSAGRDHLHHHLVDAGLSVNRTVLVMVLLHAVLVLAGLATNAHEALQPVMFWLFVLFVIIYHALLPALVRRLAPLHAGL